jgi:hypothetical protein
LELVFARQIRGKASRGLEIRMGIPLDRVLDHRPGDQLIARQKVIDVGHGEIQIRAVILVAEFREELAHSTGVELGPAIVVVEARCREVVRVVLVSTVLRIKGTPIERASPQAHARTGEFETTLGIDGQGPPQSVEAIHRIGSRNYGDTRNRDLGNEIP